VFLRALEKAARSGMLPRIPAYGATLPRTVQPEMSALEESQVSQLLVAANGTRHEALYRLAIATGMRQGELLGLKWTDIEWKKGVINVQRQVQRVPGKGFIFDDPKTLAGRRSVRVGQNVLQSLAQHKERQELEIFYAGERWQAFDLVFPSTFGTPLDQRNLLRDYYATLKMAGLPRIRFHDLRHTAASLLISHETPINVVSAMLGHSKPSVTLDIYAHVYSGRQEQAAALMDELVSPVAVDFGKESFNNAKSTEKAAVAHGCTRKKEPAEKASSNPHG
jgi:integrase